MFLLPLSLGCLSANSFPDRYAHTACSELQDCYGSDFDATYTDLGQCADPIAALINCMDACAYDSAQAHRCMDDLKAASCDGLSSGDALTSCATVYDCTGVEDQVNACMGN